MDGYYLSKEDWDSVVELGVDQNKDDLVLKKISAATKAALTKKYVILLTMYTLVPTIRSQIQQFGTPDSVS